jgi:putative membrane protein
LTFRDVIAEDHSRLMFGCGRGNRAPLSPTGKAITVTASRGMSRSSRSSRGESSVIGNVLNYLFYFVATTAMLLIAGFVYVRFTPSNEVALIREGNVAAGVALSGAMLGYACIVYSAITHGSTLLETAMWSAIALAVQIVACELLRIVIRDDWKAQIEKGDLAHGVALGAFSLAVGMINAACLTP